MPDFTHVNLPPIPRVAILGVGQMGLVCADILAQPDPAQDDPSPRARVTMWGHD